MLILDIIVLVIVILCITIVYFYPKFVIQNDDNDYIITKEEVLIDQQFSSDNFPSIIYSKLF